MDMATNVCLVPVGH